MALRWARSVATNDAESKVATSDLSPGALLALAYPDRVARNRGANGAFVLANGRGAVVDHASALARETYLAVAEITGSAAQGRIVLAAVISLAEIEQYFSEQIENRDQISFDDKSASLRGRRLRSPTSSAPEFSRIGIRR